MIIYQMKNLKSSTKIYPYFQNVICLHTKIFFFMPYNTINGKVCQVNYLFIKYNKIHKKVKMKQSILTLAFLLCAVAGLGIVF